MDPEVIQNRKSKIQTLQGHLAQQYFLIFIVLLGGGLLMSGVLELYFRYHESRAQIATVQGQIADKAAQRIAQFILTIEDHMKTATISSVVAREGIGSDYRFELAKLLATTPAITDVLAVGADGQLRGFSFRFRVEPSVGEQDLSKAPGFLQAKQGITYFGPVNFVDDAEPFMNLAVPIESFPGKVIGALQAKIDLRQIWQVVRDLKFSDTGYSYVVTRSGDLIAHSNPGIALQRLRISNLAQIQAAFQPNFVTLTSRTYVARSLTGEQVLSSFVFLPNLEWAVFVEQPVSEAYKNLYGSILRTSVLLLIGLGMALIASVFIGRRVVRPLAVLRASVERIAAGDLDHRIEIKTGNEIETLAEEFNKMSAALRRSYRDLEARVRQRTKEITALLEITSITTHSLETDAVLQQVAAKICDTFELDNVRIYSYGQNQERLQQWAIAGPVTIDADSMAPFRGKGLVALVADRGEAIIFEDIENDTSYPALSQNYLSRQMGFRFLAIFPIKFKGRVLGIIVCNNRAPRTLTEAERRLMISMADQLGPAFENLDLFKALRQQTMALEIANGNLNERSRELSAMFEVAASATQSLELEPVLQRVAEKIIEILEFDSARIYLLDDGGATLEMRAIAGQHSDAYKHSFKIGIGIVGTVAKSGEAMIFPDIQSDARYPDVSDDRVLQARGFRFLGIFPIKSKNKFLGTLSCAGMAARLLSAAEIQLAQSLVDQLGPVIDNLNLYSRLETANRQLKELDRLKSSFLSNVSHELRTPLTAIGSLADNMLDGVTGSLTDKQSRYITGIKESGERLTRLINDLLDLSVIESGRVKVDPRSFSLSDLVSQVGAGFAIMAQEKSVQLVVAGGSGNHWAWADRDRITQVLTNLIGNAIKFTPQGGKVSVDLGPPTDDEWITISVSDTGPGIPEEERSQIFDEFYQISRPGEEKVGGVGLGLAISKKLVEMNGGTITVRSTPGEGSTFTFTVPAYRQPSNTFQLYKGARP